MKKMIVEGLLIFGVALIGTSCVIEDDSLSGIDTFSEAVEGGDDESKYTWDDARKEFSGAQFFCVCHFPDGESWMGQTDSAVVKAKMRAHCENSGGSPSCGIIPQP